ncbi:MAG: (2Fe-2S)-binding protein [Ferrovibrio sp.]|uniref:(2Fe-2S)-binding protein n=1 Tax=Ferrovibrio sp. TaxID=1917215 RepID=UPI003919FCFB
MQLSVNGRPVAIPDARAGDPLLWILREELGLVGTKFGCGQGLCGACTVHVGGAAVRSCQIAVADAAGQAIVTIEGLAGDDGILHPVQQAWIEESVPQCGYCQAGQIMSAAALLQATPRPDDATIDAAMAGNLCRCGTYARIRKAIQAAAKKLEQQP